MVHLIFPNSACTVEGAGGPDYDPAQPRGVVDAVKGKINAAAFPEYNMMYHLRIPTNRLLLPRHE